MTRWLLDLLGVTDVPREEDVIQCKNCEEGFGWRYSKLVKHDFDYYDFLAYMCPHCGDFDKYFLIFSNITVDRIPNTVDVTYMDPPDPAIVQQWHVRIEGWVTTSESRLIKMFGAYLDTVIIEEEIEGVEADRDVPE